METKIKIFNTRAPKNGTYFIGAKNLTDAARIIISYENPERVDEKFSLDRKVRELKTYSSPAWGNSMKGITPEIGLWHQNNFEVPTRLI